MAETNTPPTSPAKTAVSASPAVPQPVNKATGGPAFWVGRLRPVVITNDDRLRRIHFDAYFAGAKAAGKWEDEWPMMTEAEFTQALTDVSGLKLGGQNPDGSLPSTRTEE